MPFPLLTPELLDRLDEQGVRFNQARMGALRELDGNPYGVEIARFGSATAFKCRASLLRSKNRVLGFRSGDASQLPEILAYYRSEGLRCAVVVRRGELGKDLFRSLVEAGLWSPGAGSALLMSAQDRPPEAADPAVRVRESPPEERELYLDLFRRAFAEREEGQTAYLSFQWAEDTLPGALRYVAELDGEPVGMASLHVRDGIGSCNAAGVLPECRRRGVQWALLCHRLAEAGRLGCDLLTGGGSLFSTTHRNFERLGMRLVPVGQGWLDLR